MAKETVTHRCTLCFSKAETPDAGEFIWKDRKAYIGFYVNDKKQGFGMLLIHQCYYVGFWKNGKQHGAGKEIKDKKEKYSLWFEGKRLKQYQSKEEFIDNLEEKEQKYKKWFSCQIEEIIIIFNKVLNEL